jgi:hypothetical protein
VNRSQDRQRSTEKGRRAGGKWRRRARRNEIALGVMNVVSGVGTLLNEAPLTGNPDTAEQVTRDAVIAGDRTGGVGRACNSVLRGVVDDDHRIAVRVVGPPGMKCRAQRHKYHQRDERVGDHLAQ